MSLARTANLLGAIALGIADNILDAAERHVAHGGCTAAALCVIFSRSERAQLGGLLKKMLVGIKRDSLHAYTICRLCEDAVCAPCPMTVADEK